MRFFLLIFSMILFGCSTDIHSQIKQFNDFPKEILEQMDKMGVEKSCTLTDLEGKYLNFRLAINTEVFNFCGKKVAFFKGNAGTIRSTKKEYFDEEKYFIHQKGYPPLGSGQLIIFNEDEVKQTGYDAVIISQSKKYLTNKEVVKRLKDLR